LRYYDYMRISVVVPSFNQGKYLRETIESLLAQSGDIEIIVQDGGSTDESIEILKEYEGRIIWQSAPDGGQADAINKGLAKATGELMAYLNSDDLWLPGTADKLRQAFADKPSVGIVYGEGDLVDAGGRFLHPYKVENYSYARMLERCYICQPATAWRREVYERIGGMNATLRYNMDYEYWLRAGRAGVEFLRLPEKLALSRWHSEAKSASKLLEIHEEALAMLSHYNSGRAPAVTWLRGTADAWARQEMAASPRLGLGAYAASYLKKAWQLKETYDLGWSQMIYIWMKLRRSYQRSKEARELLGGVS
jgi:glycosyltransferase involved in cell wall biosynthesis